MAELKPFDFSLFSDAQLLDLAYQVRIEIARRRQERRELAKATGHLVDSRAPRYRNPDNPSETWSGHGRPPRWVRRALDSGVELDVFEVDDSE